MYGSEPWTLYRKQVRQLRTIQQHHPRFILKIKWDNFVTNNEVLRLTKADDIECLLNKNRLRWLGHVARMPETRADKALLYGELAEGKRKVGCPMLRLKDTIEDDLKRGEVLDSCTESVDSRPEWRKLTHEVCSRIDKKRRENNERMREKRHQRK